MKTVGSFLVVELMRQGASPGEACKVAVERIVRKYPNYREIQVGYLAMNKQGEYGSYSIHKGFSYAVHDGSGNRSEEHTSKLQSLMSNSYAVYCLKNKTKK